MFVSWTGYLFPWLPAESSWVAWACARQNIKHVSEHGIMFKALYWYLRSSPEQGPKSKRIFLNRVSYFPDYSLKQGQGFTVSAAHPHSITAKSAPPPPPGIAAWRFFCLVPQFTGCDVTSERVLQSDYSPKKDKTGIIPRVSHSHTSSTTLSNSSLPNWSLRLYCLILSE